MNLHVLPVRYRAALGFGFGGLLTLLPVALNAVGLMPPSFSIGETLFSGALTTAMLGFGACGALGAFSIGLSPVLTGCWGVLFLLEIPLQGTLTYLIAPAVMEGYPSWVVWSVVAIPQIFAMGIVGTAAGFVSEGRKMATWGGRAMAVTGVVLYFAFVSNPWVPRSLTWFVLIVERAAAFGLGGWLYGVGLERVENADREAALKAAAE